MALEQNGFLTVEELVSAHQYPSRERFEQGPIAVLECIQQIPCNPCESSCKFNAIAVGEPITNLPRIDEDKCRGCGACVAKCPGMAVFIIDKTYSEQEAAVSFPYEYYPLPKKGQVVDAVDRKGQVIAKGEVISVQNPGSFDRTSVVTVKVPRESAEEVRSIKRM